MTKTSAGEDDRDARGVIDIHQHFFSPAQLAREREGARARHITPQKHILEWSPQRALDEMDAVGVARAIGSISTPGVWFGDAAEAARLAQEWNDYSAELAARTPSRFGFFATTPLPDVDRALREIDRAYAQLNADGVGLFTNYKGRYLGDATFAPLLEELDRRSSLVFVHPTAPAYEAPLPQVLPQLIEFSFETARAIVSLLLAGCVARYPRIRWIFSHSGGALPILSDRLERLLDQPAYREQLPNGFRAAVRSFHFDSTGMSSRANADLVRTIAAPENILFGSDAPFVSAAKGVAALASLHWETSEMDAIRSGSARRLLSRSADGSAHAAGRD